MASSELRLVPPSDVDSRRLSLETGNCYALTAPADRTHPWPPAQHAGSPRCGRCGLSSSERIALSGQSAPALHQRCPSTPQMLIVGKTVQAAPVPAHGIDRPLPSLSPSSTANSAHRSPCRREHLGALPITLVPFSGSRQVVISEADHSRSLPRRMTLLSPISKQSNSSDSLRRPNGGARRPGIRTRL